MMYMRFVGAIYEQHECVMLIKLVLRQPLGSVCEITTENPFNINLSSLHWMDFVQSFIQKDCAYLEK